MAIAIRVVAALLPFVCSVLATRAVQRRLPTPQGFGELLATWVLLAVVGTIVLWSIERVSRRLLPLAALLKMSLVFPDAAPSRFRSAIRTGTVAQLERRIEDVQEQGIGNTPAEAARTLIDLLAALNRHDRLTRGHAERVRAYARLIGEEMGFDEEKLDLLHWAALVHDIGKLVVPSEILTKPGKLTDEEFAIVREHPAAGAAMVEPLADWLGDWRLAVLEHHERWDGQGYPNGLVGEEISLAGRIVAVADVFDVITSPRSYKPAISADEARKEIARCSGTQFDPTVVRAFLNIGISRLRLFLGPLAWLSQIRFIGDLPLAPIGAVASGAAASVAAVVGGVVGTGGPDASVAAEAATQPPTTEVAWGDTPTTQPTTTTTYVAPPTTTTTSTTSTTVPEELPPAEQVVEVVVDDSPKEMEPVPPAPPATAPPPTVPPTTAPPTTVPRTTEPPRTSAPPTTAPPPTTTTTPPPPPPPVNNVPVAVADVLAVAAGTSRTVDVLDNDTDGDGDDLELLAIDTSGVDGGTVTFDANGDVTFTADVGASGTDTIVYTVEDGNGGVTQGSLTVTIGVNGSPVAARDTVAVAGGEVVVAAPGVLANDSEPDGETMIVTDLQPQNAAHAAAGTLTWAADGSFEFDAAPGFEGLVRWTYTVEDPAGNADTEKLELTVTDNPFHGFLYLTPDGLLSFTPPPVADPEPSPTQIDRGGAAAPADANGLRGAIDASGRQFGVWTSDDLPTDIVLDSDLTVELFNRFVDTTRVGEDGVVAVWFQECNPATNNCETLAHVGPDRIDPWNGGNPGWQRTDVVVGAAQRVVSSGRQLRLVVAVNLEDIEVAASGGRPSRLVLGHAPVAVDDAVTVDEDTTVDADVLANDTDADGDDLTITSVATAANGTASITANGVRFVPAPGWFGTEAIQYTITDELGQTTTATLTVEVTPVEDDPVAADDTDAADAAGLTVAAPGLLGNDTDQDADALTVVDVTPATSPAGTLTVQPDGSFTFTPDPTFDGEATWTYTVEDATGRHATATLTIDVAGPVTLFLGPGGTMAASAQAGANPEPDDPADGDADPGRTVSASGGVIDLVLGLLGGPGDTATWTSSPVTSPLVLDGPAGLELWSALDGFSDGDGALSAWLQDCDADGTGCITLGQIDDEYVADWSGGVSDWVQSSWSFGTLDHTVATGRTVRLVVAVDRNDLWIAMSGDRPTGLVLTTGL